MRRITWLTAVAVALMLFFSGPASATVTMTGWEGGTGFVGKGDVQTAYGWTNKQLQANASDVAFWTLEVDTYQVECNAIFYHYEVQRTTGIASSVSYDVRKGPNAQVTGYTLTGKTGSLTVTVNLPPCIGFSGTPTLQETTFKLFVYRPSQWNGVLGTLATLLSNRLLVYQQTFPVPVS